MENIWDKIASEAAEHFGEHLFAAHRGVIPSDHFGVMAAFGNDGYSEDDRAKREVQSVRDCIARGGGIPLGFGTTADGYSWALLYRAENLSPEKVKNAMRDAWGPAGVQAEIADATILDAVLSRFQRDIISPN